MELPVILWGVLLGGGIGGMVAVLLVLRARSEADRARQETAALQARLDQTSESLRRSESRYSLAVRAAVEGFWEWDLESDQLVVSPRWRSMLGLEGEDPGTGPAAWLSRVHPLDIDRLQRAIAEHIDGGSSALEAEYRIRHRDGDYRWMRVSGVCERNADGMAIRLAGSQADITAQRQTERQLVQDSLRDVLTGLPNRAVLMDLVRRALARAKRLERPSFALLFLDLDRFKSINDSFGHAAGDQLLISVARRLETCLRPGDAVARLGGDEFVILLYDLHSESDATAIAERVQNELERPFLLGGQELFTSASVGIALGSSEYDRPEDLLQDADLAMYRAKGQGRARYELFDAEMRVTARARLRLEHELRRALDRQEFTVHYQPIVSTRTGGIAGFEALLRWQHPQRGLLNAAAFVPLAEEMGLIVPIGHWVLREACRQIRSWQTSFPSSPPLTISVNISARELMHPRLLQQVERVLCESSIEPETLKLEITESAFLDDPESAVAALRQLRALGAQLHLDDFGTGYSSLAYLHRFPISSVKIDRYFVSRLLASEDSLAIVRTILGLARSLGLDVIAEGAETEAQRLKLESLDCPYMQGYVCAPPMAPEKAATLIAAGYPGAVPAVE